MTLEEYGKLLDVMLKEENTVRHQGNAEYAHSEDTLANFKRVAERLSLECPCCKSTVQITPEIVLMVYMEKHLDGVHSFNAGHRSQREDVRGRIKDIRVYLTLLRGLIEEREAKGSLASQALIPVGEGK